MFTQHAPAVQQDSILILLLDPDFTAWSDVRQAEDAAAFDAWLAGPEGQAWIEAEAEADLERRCLSPHTVSECWA